VTTSIASDYVQLMDTIGRRLDVPRISSIHIAPFEADPRKSGKFGAMVLSDGTVGLTYTGLDDVLRQLQVPSRTQELIGQSPLRVAQLYRGESGWQRSLGMAAINAVSQFVLRASGYALPNMSKTFAQLRLSEGDHMGMVGYFPPLVEQARANGTRLTVLELDDRRIGVLSGVFSTTDK